MSKLTMVSAESGIKIAIDRGGTFTDIWADIPGKGEVTTKLLSVDPNNYEDAPTEAIRRILGIFYGKEIPRGYPLPKKDISSICMGTTVATNALLERKGSKHALIITKGFGDLLEIGSQSRPRLFDINIIKPDLLYKKVVEIDERITIETFDEDIAHRITPVASKNVFKSKITGDWVRIVKPLDIEEVTKDLKTLKDEGYDNIAVCLMHSYLFPDHEKKIGEIAKNLGFNNISLSSAVGANMIKMVPRCSSASADAYLTPVVKNYINSFKSGFEDGTLDGVRCEFMQSDGGLVEYTEFSGLKGILSGPAGGVVGYSKTCYNGETPVIGFDMGGTSTDVSRYGGKLEHVFETTTAGVTIQSPQLDINTVAAGGGSICFWENGLFRVGPESASADPGPACYRKGGPLTVTDCNLYLGRIVPEYFPSIFGPNEDEPLDIKATTKLLKEVAKKVSTDTGKAITEKEVALGFIEVADESMCRPIRALTESKGFETNKHVLSCFGGAGGQHACEIAKQLNINRVILHKYSSILSAYGMSLADIVQEAQVPCSAIYSTKMLELELFSKFEELKKKAYVKLVSSGSDTSNISYECYLNMRYRGTDTSLMVLQPKDNDFQKAFEAIHKREFTFIFDDGREILVDDVRVRAICHACDSTNIITTLTKELHGNFSPIDRSKATLFKPVTFPKTGTHKIPVFEIDSLPVNTTIDGPAMLIDQHQTIVVIPDSKAKILSNHIVIDIDNSSKATKISNEVVDPIKLSVFGNRFMSIAEQMGRTLQKIAISLNIKERYDFSCAVFGPDAGLVANAPHVPVHLGSMSYAVKYQHELLKGKLKDGDVLVSNHPEAGGTHLPDITVITPVFDDTNEIAFYVASRGHHTDIGGLGGTSFPPDSTELWQEGAAIRSFKLVSNGEFDEDGVRKIFEKPGEYPGCTPSRRIRDNLSDLKAQIAANNKGSTLIKHLIREYSKSVVHFYMSAIQKNAEIGVREYLKKCCKRLGTNVLYSEDCMDNSSVIKLKITIDSTTGTAKFDFTGTSPELYGNMNAPPAICYSAIIYCMRLLVGTEIPLNQGCLAPIKVILPKGSLINPSAHAAVCAGNTDTSQRLVDVILKPFRVVAASQGCMNCLGFYGEGNRKEGFAFVYGETVCGGSGAGPGFDGASAVQVHMTNTKLTDVEVLERKFPVILREFSIKRGTGGKGRWCGGCGVYKDFECLLPLQFSIISERRVTQPYGMEGGEPGARGINCVRKFKEGGGFRLVNVGPKAMIALEAGEHFLIQTPGGGGWGSSTDTSPDQNGKNPKFSSTFRANGTVSILSDAQAASS